ncbi:MAG: rRNA maturation RNase YbeY [Planctomycetes bacterium]|nr:rRNA maturation RNase YbeY [Planctomycetota bacterium]
MSEVRVLVSDQRPPGGPEVPPLGQIATVGAHVLAACGQPHAELSVTLVDDARIAQLHLEYMQIPGPTDVISFPLGDPEDPIPILGEVVVSVDTAAREAAERGLSLKEELLRYVVHGTLHLFGYDDHEPEERERMHARQEELLAESLAALS